MKDFIGNILSDILHEYANIEIKNEYEIGKERDYIREQKDKNKALIKYAANSIKIDVENNKDHHQRYDWDSITYKDKEGNLLSFISEYILADDEISKIIAATKFINQGIENLKKYYENEFDNKVEEVKASYTYYGHNDYMEA